MSLFWIQEGQLQPVSDDDRIYFDVVAGKRPEYLVAIYEGAEIDPDLSAKDGRNRYRNAPMICIRIKGEKDFISEPLKPEHAQRFPRAWGWWQAHRGDSPKVSVQLLPGISAADLMELDELRLNDLASLAEVETIPDNLAKWREMAQRFRTLSKPRLRIVDGKLEQVA